MAAEGQAAASGAEKKTLREGAAVILLDGDNDVFYNKAQVVNRDLSIAVLRHFNRVRAAEHAEGVWPKSNRRFKGGGAPGSPLLPHLVPPPPPEPNPASDEPREVAAGEAEQAAGEAAEAAKVDDQGEQQGDQQDEAPKPKRPQELRPMRVLEGLAASGLRAIRYAREVEGVGVVVANDMDEAAAESIRVNTAANGPVAQEMVIPHHADARVLMMTHEGLFDVVDLDPYGTPVQLLDSGVQAVADGGLMCITATDMAVLCGNNAEVCRSKYGAFPAKAKHCHEQALRILLGCIEAHANRHRRYIKPVLSVSVDFYIRVFVRVYTSPAEVKRSSLKSSYLYQCVGCDSYLFQPCGRETKTNKVAPGYGPTASPTCSDCGWRYNMAGPMWTEPIHDSEWVTGVLESLRAEPERYPGYDKVHALMTTVSEELLDAPLYYSMHNLAHTLRCAAISLPLMWSALINAGYKVSGSHANPLALKTDAPNHVVWDILRCWVQEHPVNSEKDSPGAVILAKEPELKASFARAKGAFSRAKTEGIPRFINNPEANWGPKARAGRPVATLPAPMVAAVENAQAQLPMRSAKTAGKRGAEEPAPSEPNSKVSKAAGTAENE
eukprot:CAMPEP_0183806124 /NCGR_PEP_ID=MMETSP0803_2-20130417/38773_1 /TAXON_ID=195967 /ORGANISM="Crustomastix stigmata, Strain CCMP3273" /LENGTH=608 /DNA_ID=CAMNT_0026050885 /DNA_START=131 /DNA_END=1957 /DNA_ORIENTATION=-